MVRGVPSGAPDPRGSAFVLHVSDIVEEGGDAVRWHREFFGPARRLLSTTPLWAVLGNHEADSPLYYRYFGGPAPGWRQTFLYGDAQFFLVDSERDLSPGSEQYTWLDEGLSRSRSRWRIVAVHRPPFTSDRDEYGDTSRGESAAGDPRTRPLVPLLEAHDVDVLFCGHVHAYERSRPLRDGRVDERGVVYVQTGGGGGRLEESADTRSWHTAALRRCHHYVTVALSGETMELRAYDGEGRLFDLATRRSHDHRGSLDAEGAVALRPSAPRWPGASPLESPRLEPHPESSRDPPSRERGRPGVLPCPRACWEAVSGLSRRDDAGHRTPGADTRAPRRKPMNRRTWIALGAVLALLLVPGVARADYTPPAPTPAVAKAALEAAYEAGDDEAMVAAIEGAAGVKDPAVIRLVAARGPKTRRLAVVEASIATLGLTQHPDAAKALRDAAASARTRDLTGFETGLRAAAASHRKAG